MAELQTISQDNEATWERPTRVPGMSLGMKIFGASLVLVVLMILVSAASIVMVGQVRHELQVEALVFQPLADDIADIETAVLEAEILAERLRIDMIENSLDPDMAAAVARQKSTSKPCQLPAASMSPSMRVYFRMPSVPSESKAAVLVVAVPSGSVRINCFVV